MKSTLLLKQMRCVMFDNAVSPICIRHKSHIQLFQAYDFMAMVTKSSPGDIRNGAKWRRLCRLGQFQISERSSLG